MQSYHFIKEKGKKKKLSQIQLLSLLTREKQNVPVIIKKNFDCNAMVQKSLSLPCVSKYILRFICNGKDIMFTGKQQIIVISTVFIFDFICLHVYDQINICSKLRKMTTCKFFGTSFGCVIGSFSIEMLQTRQLKLNKRREHLITSKHFPI